MKGGSKLHHHVGMFALPGTLQREKRVCTSVLSSLFILVPHFYANSRKVCAAVAMDMQNASFTDQSKGEEFQWVTRLFGEREANFFKRIMLESYRIRMI